MRKELDSKLKDVLHPPSQKSITERFNAGGISFDELKAMVENEAFLRDYVLSMEELHKFDLECQSIADQTYKAAMDNSQLIGEVSNIMEQHNKVMEVYQEKRDILKEQL